MIRIWSLVLFYFFTNVLFGQAGYLDTTFGEQGIAIIDLDQNKIDHLTSLALQKDQKIIAAGTFYGIQIMPLFAALRLLPDGDLDPTFGENGIVILDFDYWQHLFFAVAIQPDGRILLGGRVNFYVDTAKSFEDDMALVRLNADGSLDTTFGTQGLIVTEGGGNSETIHEILIREDKKIIVVARSSFSQDNCLVIQYHESGEIDESFGSNGFIRVPLEGSSTVGIRGLLQPDGKLLLAGNVGIFAESDFAIMRLLEDGTTDSLFGNNGLLVTDILGWDYGTSINLDPDGKIVLAGVADFSYTPDKSHIGMVRYNPNGSLDQSFGTNGQLELFYGTGSGLYSLATQTDNKYVIAGWSHLIDSNHFSNLLVRLNYNGTPDTTFGFQGSITTMINGADGILQEVLIQNDSRILVGGNHWNPVNQDFLIARYIADFNIEYYIGGQILCPGDSGAIVGLEITGGVQPYQFSIDGVHFQEESVFTNLVAGEYCITITDSQNPPVLTVVGPIYIPDAKLPDGYVEVSDNTVIVHSDHSEFESFSINGVTFQPLNTFINVPAGTYVVTVVTSKGCTFALDTVTVFPTSITNLNDASVLLYPNPCSEFLFIDTELNLGPVYIAIYDLALHMIQKERLYTDSSGRILVNTKMLSSGCYLLEISNSTKNTFARFVVNK